ncbi:HipA domain-containing protein, partial [Bdellovibrionota bacterium FG-2]
MICKICLNSIEDQSRHAGYHGVCLKRLFGSPNVDPTLDFDKSKLEVEIIPRYSKRMSISGVQQKLFVRIEGGRMTPTDIGGTHILKPAPSKYPGICANEHVSMKIGALLGIDTPPCGLIAFSDGEWAYVIKRFDREGGKKIHQEDMAQIMGRTRDEEENYKYNGSYAEVASVIQGATGKPAVVLRFYERLVFNYLIANGDFHLKNISLQDPEADGKYRQLTPLYDSVNTRIHLPNESRDLALEELFADGSDT